MHDHREIELARECEAIQIPSGHPIVLPAGTKVIVTQSLGGTYTVATPGGLARIEQKDADALGLDGASPKEVRIKAEGSIEDAVWSQLKTVFDPEIPVNVVDLGLIYDCRVTEKDGGGRSVLVRMTLTAPGCGMGPAIAADARSRILALEGIDDAEVELVWDPPWNQSMISEEGRMKLGLV
jgi:probable FeS assembly SUF system protein SufT